MDTLDRSLNHFDPSTRHPSTLGEYWRDQGKPPSINAPEGHRPDPGRDEALAAAADQTLFLGRLGTSLKHHRRTRRSCALLLLAFEDVGSRDERLGHAMDNQLLQTLAERIQSGLRPRDLAMRLGDDTFAVILEDIIGETKARQVAERIRQQASRAIPIKGHEIRLGTSVGFALYPQDGLEPLALFQRAYRRIRVLGEQRPMETGPHDPEIREQTGDSARNLNPHSEILVPAHQNQTKSTSDSTITASAS